MYVAQVLEGNLRWNTTQNKQQGGQWNVVSASEKESG